METAGAGRSSVQRKVFACLVVLFLLSLIQPANAGKRRHRNPSPVTAALQPLLLARTVVHGVDPIVDRAPGAIATLAAAPIRVAYRRDNALRGKIVDEDEPPNALEQPFIPREVPLAQPANYDQPLRVAYMVPRAQKPDSPSAEQVEGDGQDFDPGPDLEPEPAPDLGCEHLAPQTLHLGRWPRHIYDRGYDCSGTVSFALFGAGAIAAPLPSSDLMRYGGRGRGRWLTIYSRPGHTFAVIAGLRLDTTDFQNGGNTGPRWHCDLRIPAATLRAIPRDCR